VVGGWGVSVHRLVCCLPGCACPCCCGCGAIHHRQAPAHPVVSAHSTGGGRHQRQSHLDSNPSKVGKFPSWRLVSLRAAPFVFYQLHMSILWVQSQIWPLLHMCCQCVGTAHKGLWRVRTAHRHCCIQKCLHAQGNLESHKGLTPPHSTFPHKHPRAVASTCASKRGLERPERGFARCGMARKGPGTVGDPSVASLWFPTGQHLIAFWCLNVRRCERPGCAHARTTPGMADLQLYSVPLPCRSAPWTWRQSEPRTIASRSGSAPSTWR
jgi:hypothetical protein